jgi:hypothetical protein
VLAELQTMNRLLALLVRQGAADAPPTAGDGLTYVNPDTLPAVARAVYDQLATAAADGQAALQAAWSELHPTDRALIGAAAFEAIKRRVPA